MFLNSFFILILSLTLKYGVLFVSPVHAELPAAKPTTAETKIEDSSSEKSNIFVLCKRGKESRWLRAFKTEAGKCKTYYSKEGYLQVISSATYFASCEAVLENVKKNLEEGSFKCMSRDVLAIDEIQ